MSESDWFNAWLIAWATCAVLIGLLFRTINVFYLAGGGFIASLLLAMLFMFVREERAVETATNGPSQSELLVFSNKAKPEHVVWASEQWPKVVEACPGLSRYARDLEPSTQTSYYLSGHGDGAGARVIAVIKVADRPRSAELLKYHAQGNNCFFDILHPQADAVLVGKSACQSLCLDRVVRYGEFPDGLKVPLR